MRGIPNPWLLVLLAILALGQAASVRGEQGRALQLDLHFHHPAAADPQAALLAHLGKNRAENHAQENLAGHAFHQDAIRALDGTDFGGRTIKVNEAQDKQGRGRY